MYERLAKVAAGPVFERGDDGEVLFKFVIDGGSVIGPRPATDKDQLEHLGAWREFQAREGLPAQDRNGDGAPGGRLPSDEKAELFAKLEAAGVTFDRRWGVARLQKELQNAKGAGDEPSDDRPGHL